ncbi:GPI-anchor transamidase subunit K [Nematocida sp. LUAm3]|nr:GPI-anchor transamidase subunit K [Nematocida sp. LUAm3]
MIQRLFLLLSLVLLVFCKNKALLISCSWQYENYRHFANVLTLQTLLQKNGFSHKDISVFLKSDILNDKRNTFGELCIGEDILRKDKEYASCNRRSLSYYDILNMLRGEDAIFEDANEDTNLLIYITGHGGDSFIKYCNRSFFYTDDLTNAIMFLLNSRKLNKVLIISDTCQADTLFNFSVFPSNVTFLSTSLKGESSHSSNFHHDLNIFPIDLFVLSLYNFSKNNLLKTASWDKLISKELSKNVLLSTISVHGNSYELKDFFIQSPETDSLYL